MTEKKKGWIVLPCFNEASTLNSVLDQIVDALPLEVFDFTLCVVDDGSDDGTFEVVQRRGGGSTSVTVCAIKLMRNFGKEAAIEAGLSACPSDHAFAIVMDADLQHPPVLIASMIERWEQGFPLVHVVKKHRGHESLIYKVFATAFYKLFDQLSDLNIRNHTDFKLMDRLVAEQYCALPERSKFFRGLSVWTGVKSDAIEFDVGQAIEGHRPSWSALGLISYSLASIVAFSSKPLRLFAVVGLGVFLMGLVMALVSVVQKLSGIAVDGFTTVIVLLVLLSGTTIFGVGMLGLYLSEIYDELKGRPRYVIQKKTRF